MAITLSLLFFVGWQAYMQKTYPEVPKGSAPDQKFESMEKGGPQNLQQGSQKGEAHGTSGGQKREGNLPPRKITRLSFSGKNFEALISSWGMGIEQAQLKNYKDREDQEIEFSAPALSPGYFATSFNGQVVHFDIRKEQDQVFVGTAKIGSQKIIKKMVFKDDLYKVDVSIKGLSDQFKINETLEISLAQKALEVENSMFTPAYEGTEFFAINKGTEERTRIDTEAKENSFFKTTTLASIGTQYFAVALKDLSSTLPSTRMEYNPQDKIAKATLSYPAQTHGHQTDIQFVGFMGPKKLDLLKKVDPELIQLINYGMFSVLSKPMLKMLKWFHKIFHNWGLAIILLTIFVRLILLPINLSSLKSMKRMQTIQPQLKAIKEKYKDDSVKINQETMALMKREKVNPVGGCLPMFLQLPVFFALYSVLGQSVELYKAPFIFWIQDLSSKDPFFVLPIAVGGLYFLQMSITPQPTDPVQAKMMKFIPILFCFFMITVPSGLTLYFLVNTIFGIGQSYISQREKGKVRPS